MKRFLRSFLSKSLLFLLVLAPVLSIGTAFSIFYFGDDPSIKKNINSDEYIDDVKPNYKFAEDTYTVYFFPNRGYADLVYTSIVQAGVTDADAAEDVLDTYTASAALTYFNNNKSSYKSTNTSSADARFFGYWEDDDGNASYGYKKITVETALTKAQYAQIGLPKTTALNHSSYTTSFCGWSCDLVNCRTYSFLTMGDFKYTSLFEPLRSVDEVTNSTLGSSRSICGMPKGSKVIFVYPIFSAGGDSYSGNTVSGTYNVHARIHGDVATCIPVDYTIDNVSRDYSYDEEYETSQYGTNSSSGCSTYHTYKNLVVDETSIYYLDFVLSDGLWRNFKVGNHYQATTVSRSVSPSSYSAGDKISGFSYDALFYGSKSGKTNSNGSTHYGEGVYNIYVLINRNRSSTGTGYTAYNAITTANTPLSLYQTVSTSSSSSHAYYDVWYVYVKIEKVAEFGLAGISSPLSLDDADNPLETFLRCDSGTYNNAPYVDFQANNVYIDGEKSKTKKYFSSSKGNYAFQSNVFTTLSDSFEFDDIDMVSISQSEVDTYNTKMSSAYPLTHKDFYPSDTERGLSSTSDKRMFDGGSDGTAVPTSYFENTDNLDFTFKQTNFFRITADTSSYYDVLIRVYCKAAAPTSVTKIGFALAPHDTNNLNIWIYDGSDGKIETAADLARDSDGFIDTDNSNYLIGTITAEVGDTLATDTVVTPENGYGDGATSLTVADYLGSDKVFIDHLTKLSLDIGDEIDKSYVVILKDKTNATV